MRTSAIPPLCESRSALPGSARICASCAALGALLLLGIPQTAGQITITTPAAPTTAVTPVPGTCPSYQTTVTTNGVTSNGISHPGFCAKSVLTPLFNGNPIGTTWQQLMLSPNPPKVTYRTQSSVFQTCVTATRLTVDLSARIDVSEINWAPTQTVGPVCTSEKDRVNTAPMASTQELDDHAQGTLKRARILLMQKLSTPVTVCEHTLINGKNLEPLLYQKIWSLLKAVSTEEQNTWNDPENANAAQCVPQCNLCNPGWVGTLTCTKKVRDTDTTINYTWDEVQTWVIGGTPQQQGGSTVYPATYSANGSGSKTGITWPPFNLTYQGTLTVSGTQQSPTFQTLQISKSQVIPSVPQGNEANEVAYQLQPFHLSPNTFTYGGTTPPPNSNGYACDTPQKPGPASCEVDCTWSLSFQ